VKKEGMENRSEIALAPKDVRSAFTRFSGHHLKKAGTTGTAVFPLYNQALALFRYGTDNKITGTKNRVIHRQRVI
jgi:hypothetical protein